jgi:dephospho-CoA kinase
LPHIEEALSDHDTVVVDGIRSGVEVDRFEDAYGDAFTLVSIEAPFETRAERLELRGRDAGGEEGGETLDERDQRELDFGMGEAIDRADVTVENDGSLATFRERIREILTDS